MSKRNVIIIGSGPAGLTAAIYASRANLNPLMIEGYQAGGQLMITTEVENYPGFPKGITGPELIAELRKQAARFGTEFITKNVTKVDFKSKPFKLWVDAETFEADTVIISTGADARWLNLPSEDRLKNRGVSACATCDGAFFRNKDVIVVGGGDTAMEEANFLSRLCSKVYMVHRREEFRASKIMLDRAQKNPKIGWKLNAVVEEFVGENKLESVKLKSTKDGSIEDLKVQGAFIAIGHVPNSQLFKGLITMDENGYIKTNHGTKTNIPGVFACGDVQDHEYRQAITAAGTGCMAALDAERYLQTLNS